MDAEDVFSNELEQRQKFSDYFKDTIEPLIKKLMIEMIDEIEKKKNVFVFLGGSHAWSNLIIDQSNLNKLERVSICPGNYDMFCFTTEQ